MLVFRRLTFITIIFICYIGCQEEPVTGPADSVESGSWMVYSPYKWSHDGQPYVSEYCRVFSDGASYDMKKAFAEFSDDKFVEVSQLFDFDNQADLRYPPGYDMVDIYLNRYHQENIAAAYWGSVFITIRTDHINVNRYNYLMKHELTHVFQFLIEGHVNLSSEIWFTEGIAIYCGGGLWGIRDIADLENWIAQNSTDPNQGNPICIHIWDDFPPEADITGYYCNVFDLTMRYLLDERGMGKSINDVLTLFYDLRNDISFPESFEENFGISVGMFENQYYDRMREYLSQLQ